MQHKKLHRSHHSLLYSICIIGFVFALHLTLPIYINSTFLSQFTTEDNVGLIYTLASVATILAFIWSVYFLNKKGNYKAVMWFCLVEFFVLFGLAMSQSIWILAPLFLLMTVLVAMIGLSIDIFLESESTPENTGRIRGLYMTSINIAWIMAPVLAGAILKIDDYWKVYIASMGLILPLVYLLHKNFRKFKDPVYSHASIMGNVSKIWGNKDIRKIFFINILLNLFYAWMVIYSPIYLHQYIGFSWETIGLIFTIMLLPFIIFELPFGELADKKYGEKEIMILGFIILGISTIALSQIEGAKVLYWAGALFMTRVGASIAEIMIETYFFKKVPMKDTGTLSLFRVTRPTGYLIAPILTVILLPFIGYQHIFTVLGCLILLGTLYIFTLKDTK
jgi:MFS family permease